MMLSLLGGAVKVLNKAGLEASVRAYGSSSGWRRLLIQR